MSPKKYKFMCEKCAERSRKMKTKCILYPAKQKTKSNRSTNKFGGLRFINMLPNHFASYPTKPKSIKRVTEEDSVQSKMLSDQVSLSQIFMKSGVNKIPTFLENSVLRLGKPSTLSISKEMNPTHHPCMERRPKIRFTIPDGTLAYEDAKQAMWKRRTRASKTQYGNGAFCREKKLILADSMSTVLPVLERLKRESGVIKSELNLNKIREYIREENSKRARKRLVDECVEILKDDIRRKIMRSDCGIFWSGKCARKPRRRVHNVSKKRVRKNQ